MNPPLFVRSLTASERSALCQALRSPHAFTLRRVRILLDSEHGQRPSQIAKSLGYSAQAVRDVLHAFAVEGLGCLCPKSKAPKRAHATWSRDHDEGLRVLLHQSPRTFGKPTSLWTLELAAQVCHEKGWTNRRLTGEAIRLVLKRLGVGWKRAKHWLVSPDPEYARKKTSRPTHRAGGGPPGLGFRLSRRDLVDSPGSTQPLRLVR